MSMTLDEAIRYATDLVGETGGDKDYQQLADWLDELKERREKEQKKLPSGIYVLSMEWHNDSTPRYDIYKTEEGAKKALRELIEEYGVNSQGKCMDMDGRTVDECVEDEGYCNENCDSFYIEYRDLYDD